MRFIVKRLLYFELDKKTSSAPPPENIQCRVCLLPMQYQTKINGKFLWQCFKCGKKYFVVKISNSYVVEETWSPPK